MRLLILGGNGFIGSHLQDELILQKQNVIVIDRQAEKFRSELDGVEYIYGNINDIDLLSSCLNVIDCVIHLGSSTLPAESNLDPLQDIQSNLVTTVKLLQTSVDFEVKKFVYVSTGGIIYGIPQNFPVDENHPTNPICSYGIIKLAIEKYIALFSHLHGLDYVILRPSNPYGERQNPFKSQGVISVFLWRIINNLPINVYGEGEIIRDYLHVGDLSKAIYSAIAHNGPSKIFNVGSGKGLSINELINLIQSNLNERVNVQYFPTRAFDVPKIVLNNDRIRSEMKWKPKISLDVGIQRTWSWLKQLKHSQ